MTATGQSPVISVSMRTGSNFWIASKLIAT